MIPRPRVRALEGDDGSGLIATIGGVSVFLILLSFAVQLLFNAYATSAITAATHDAAHMVARGGFDPDDESAIDAGVLAAETHARTVLGRYGERIEFRWLIDNDQVELTVVGQHPNLAVERVSAVFGLNQLERTVVVRMEKPR